MKSAADRDGGHDFPCDIEWHEDSGVVVAACGGRDRIKVWPLPVEAPWFEEPEEQMVASVLGSWSASLPK